MLDLGRTLLQSVERSPRALAIVDGPMRLTYGEWFERILRAAGGLSALGLRRGDRLLLVMQNRWEMATLHWACQLLGVVVVPLNWRAKADEVDYCAQDADVSAVAFDASGAAAIAAAARLGGVVRIAAGGAGTAGVAGTSAVPEAAGVASGTNDAPHTTDASQTTGAPCEGAGATVEFATLLDAARIEPIVHADAEDLSVLLYTSGTTGRPKGVPRRHRAERAAALAHVAQNLYARGERTLGVMPLYHTMGVRSLLAMALVDGVFVCLPRFEAGAALRLIAEERITNLYLVPTLYHDLLAHPAFATSEVASVRKLGFAGAAMPAALLHRVQAAFQPELFVNHYGSSEVYTFTVEQDAGRKPGSAGRAGVNARIRVVRLGARSPDQCARPGEEGEIVADLAGDEAFEGYWKRPDADAKALREGWYFTGDTGRIDADGDLFVTGRVDDMIISGGENIAPADIESVLSLHPAVDEVAVAGLPDARWGQRVTAFIKRRTTLRAGELDAHCRTSALADFKRPREYVFVREIPKSPVGKILRRKLVSGEFERDE